MQNPVGFSFAMFYCTCFWTIDTLRWLSLSLPRGEEEFKKMRTDPNVLDIFFRPQIQCMVEWPQSWRLRLGMEEDAMVQRLNHMQEIQFRAVGHAVSADTFRSVLGPFRKGK